MKVYLTPNDLLKISNIKGNIIKEKNNIVMVKQKSDLIEPGTNVFTVWNPESGLKIISTMNEEDANLAFTKYTNL